MQHHSAPRVKPVAGEIIFISDRLSTDFGSSILADQVRNVEEYFVLNAVAPWTAITPPVLFHDEDCAQKSIDALDLNGTIQARDPARLRWR